MTRSHSRHTIRSRPAVPSLRLVGAAWLVALVSHPAVAQPRPRPDQPLLRLARIEPALSDAPERPSDAVAAGLRRPEPGPAAQTASETAGRRSAFDRIWKFAEWYRNDGNPVVQSVLFSGRYQHEFAAVRADEGDLDEWNVRRMRMGVKAGLFHQITVHGEVELNPQERDPLYVRFTDLYVEWAGSDAAVVTVGKQGVPFTMDGATSSKELLTIDRNTLTNNIWFTQEYMPGVSLSGEASGWTYQGGLYSSGSATREVGEFDGGVFTLALLGYDLGPRLNVRRARVTGSYLYQQADPDNTFTRPLDHIASATLDLEAGVWGLRADVSAASGYDSQPGLRGAMAMPFFNVTEKLQLVARYTWLDSIGPNGIGLGTYENRIVRGRGDRFDEIYLGVNYYFYGHKLKLQSGAQLADLDDRAGDGGDYSGFAWTTGIRVSW